MADGTLPEESFKFYLIQDYLYLVRQPSRNSVPEQSAKFLGAICESQCSSGLQSKVYRRYRCCK